MKLHELTAQYVAYKQSMGMRFQTEARVLKSFCRVIGDVDVDQTEQDAVQAFLDGSGPVTCFWHRKYEVLCGFYRFAIARRYIGISPLPQTVPRRPPPFVPHIFSRNELQRLLSAGDSRTKIEPRTFRTLLLTLYGAGLRISEALSLTLADVDLSLEILTIRESKFYKTRFVPIGTDLVAVMTLYKNHRLKVHPAKLSAPFFVSRAGEAVTRQAAETQFRRICSDAGVKRHDGARYQPRLHDLRHSAAVHRLILWYRNGSDVRQLLPQLSTYLGHVHIAATQRYLTMTPELLSEASRRFEHYAMEEPHD